jgi:quinol monooxygenase YgiN
MKRAIGFTVLMLFAFGASNLSFNSKDNNKFTVAISDAPRYGLTGKFQAKEGKANELVFILLQASRLASKAKGCNLYVVNQDNADKTVISVYEVWDTKEDHDNFLVTDGAKELMNKATPLSEGTAAANTLEVIGGKGINF